MGCRSRKVAICCRYRRVGVSGLRKPSAILSSRSAFERSSNAFNTFKGRPNVEPDHRSSSAYSPNLGPDFGPVHEKSGSNRGSEPDLCITIPQYPRILAFGTQKDAAGVDVHV